MGFDGFAYEDPAAIFAEHAALSAFENDGTRDFDLGGLADISAEEYAMLPPTQWPRRHGDARYRRAGFLPGVAFLRRVGGRNSSRSNARTFQRWFPLAFRYC